MFKAFLLVGLGGFFGSIARYGVQLLTDKFLRVEFPLATFAVNITGCFIIGMLAGYIHYREDMPGEYWLLLATGFCGAFTTFSTFALENNWLLADRQAATAVIYTLLSVVLGLVSCRLGMGVFR